MKVEDSRAFYALTRNAHLTYEGETMHRALGPCTIRIYRYIGNDSGTTAQRTLDTIKKNEPNVGMWPGDIIEYWQEGRFVYSILG